MNVTLFTSVWAVVAAALSAVFLGWMLLVGAAPGSRYHVDLQLWSGWATLFLMAGVCLYSLRKYAHKLKLSPELKMKVPVEQLEEAERRLNEVRRRILMGLLTDAAEVEAEAAEALVATGADRVCRPVVRRNPGIGPSFLISVAPKEPLGRMRKWLHFHAYLGLASGVVLFVHGGGALGSPLGLTMNLLAALVIVTGIAGMILFALGPRWMTRAERDMNFEDAFVLERGLRRKVKAAYENLKPEQRKVFRKAEKTGSTAVLQRTSLTQMMTVEPAARRELEDVMVLVSQRRRILEDLRGAARIRFYVNVWRLVHVPASILLLGVSLVHAASVIWY